MRSCGTRARALDHRPRSKRVVTVDAPRGTAPGCALHVAQQVAHCLTPARRRCAATRPECEDLHVLFQHHARMFSSALHHLPSSMPCTEAGPPPEPVRKPRMPRRYRGHGLFDRHRRTRPSRRRMIRIRLAPGHDLHLQMALMALPDVGQSFHLLNQTRRFLFLPERTRIDEGEVAHQR